MKIKDSFYESLSPLFGGHGTWLSFFLFFYFFSCHFGIILSVQIFLDSLCLFCKNTGEINHCTWSFILWMDEMEWLTSSVEV
jgi:hypothetical protein